MRIVFFTDQVYLHGGIEKVLAQKVNYFINEGHEVHLITTENKNNSFCYEMSSKLNHHDLEIPYVRTKSYFSLSNLKCIPKHYKKLKKKLSIINPEVLIVCNFTLDFFLVPLLGTKVKTIREYHGSRYYQHKEFPKSSFLKRFMFKVVTFFEKKYSYIVVLNEDEKKYYKTNNVVVIPNSIDVKNVVDNLEFKEKKKIIIAAGRIAPVKQFDKLIDVWSVIYRKFPDWNLDIYGEGDDIILKSLKEKISKEGVKNITLKGQTNGLKEKMIEASLYVMTSKTECFPMVLLEAISVGLPVVSFDCPHGPRNIVRHNEDGLLVEDQNVESMAKSIEELILDRDLRKDMGLKGINNVKRFSPDKVMRIWNKIINE